MELNEVYELQRNIRIRMAAAGVAEAKMSVRLGRPKEQLNVSIGVGVTERKNEYRLAVRFRGQTRLHSRLETQITKWAEGEVDVLYTGPVVAASAAASVPPAAVPEPLRIGSAIAHAQGVRDGTLGFFARRICDQALGFVSNNHVIALEDEGEDDSEVVQPGRGVVAHLRDRLPKRYPRLHRSPFVKKEVDCAFAELVGGVSADHSSLLLGGQLDPVPMTPRDGIEVFKIGATSGRTRGRIRAFNFDKLTVEYTQGRTVDFENQIEIETTTNDSFADPGDSGSLVLGLDNRPVGLYFAETGIGGANNNGLQYANPIGAVLLQLGVELV